MPEGSNSLHQNGKRRRSVKRLASSRCCGRSCLCDLPAFLTPKSIEDVRELARLIALAEWAPPSYRDLEGNYLQQKIELAIMHGATVGLGPLAAVQSIALINGMPTIWGDGALALVERSGLLEDMVEQDEFDEEHGLTAICTIKRRRRPTPITSRFSMAMADQARLTQKEGPWQTYPQRMLRMRARSWTLRDGFADVLRGLHIREEVDDFIEIRGVKPPLATVVADRPILPRLSTRGSPRPKRSAGSSLAKPPAPESVTPLSNDKLAPHQSRPNPEEPQQQETFTLIDADGAFIEVVGPSALQNTFGDMFFNEQLSMDQITGLWESNEMARAAIARLLGPDALTLANARFQSARTNRDQKGEGRAIVASETASASIPEADRNVAAQRTGHSTRAAPCCRLE
jgi:hypothetical protein